MHDTETRQTFFQFHKFPSRDEKALRRNRFPSARNSNNLLIDSINKTLSLHIGFPLSRSNLSRKQPCSPSTWGSSDHKSRHRVSRSEYQRAPFFFFCLFYPTSNSYSFRREGRNVRWRSTVAPSETRCTLARFNKFNGREGSTTTSSDKFVWIINNKLLRGIVSATRYTGEYLLYYTVALGRSRIRLTRPPETRSLGRLSSTILDPSFVFPLLVVLVSPWPFRPASLGLHRRWFRRPLIAVESHFPRCYENNQTSRIFRL